MSKVKQVLIAIGIIIALILIWYLVVVFWYGSTKPILAVADKFKPDAIWVMTSETVKPPKIICGEVTSRCPEVARVWQAKNSTEMTYEKFAALLDTTGWPVKLDGHNCDSYGTPSGGTAQRCYASGVDGGFYIQVYYSAPDDHNKPEISLFVVKR